MARGRARAGSGHGRLGAALRVVAALLRAGEPVPPLVRGVPRSARAVSAAPASGSPGAADRRAHTRDFSPTHTCVPLAAGLPDCLGHLCRGTVFAGEQNLYCKSPARPQLTWPSRSVLTLFRTG